MKCLLQVAILLSLLNQTVVRAQSTVSISYAISFATGNTGEFISKTSFRGVTVDFRQEITPQISAGLSTGWYTFYERKDFDTYTSQSGESTFSGIQYRYLNSAPILALFDYYLRPDEIITPFVGLGIGSTYNNVSVMMGLFEVEINSWHFTLAPEIGFRLTGPYQSSGFLSARYNHNFSTSELDEQGYLSINIGVLLGM